MMIFSFSVEKTSVEGVSLRRTPRRFAVAPVDKSQRKCSEELVGKGGGQQPNQTFEDEVGDEPGQWMQDPKD